MTTKRDPRKGDLLSVDEATQNKLNTLSDEFDALLARMQKPKSRLAMKSAFNASPRQLGKAAIAGARKRNR
ncbi:MAG TPA: hypothetical protein VKD65_04935 [Candidatus Angelobacter sp.]|nr:hypothetical protein [Candidatus Angelobacter sp.]